MLRRIVVAFTSLLALAAAEEKERCFVTNDWRSGVIVPGEANVLIWAGGPNRDVLLEGSVDKKEPVFAGAIARNVSQGSVFWVPPKDIANGTSDELFEIQLWDMENGFGCSSPAFRFAEVDINDDEDDATAVPFGPFVTTAISILNTGYVTVTATVATYESDGPIFEQAVTGSITATDGVVTSGSFSSIATVSVSTAANSGVSSTSIPDRKNDQDDSGPNVIAIVVGTIGGVLVVALVVLSVLLWRARRKRVSRKARADSVIEPPKEVSPMSTPDSQMSEVGARPVTATEVSGDTARHEMLGDSSAPQELPTENMDPVELPADEIPPPSYPGHERNMDVSPTTGDSRRSSLSFDKGTFTVSPLSERRDRKE